MKNIMKIMIALFTSVSIVSSASAGDLTVTGTAKATINSVSGGTNGASAAKGIGITNEIDFGATGELDNGWTWKYQAQMDPSAGSTADAVIDDTRLEITTPYATLGIYNSEGGLDTDNKASQSVYGRPTDIGVSSGMADSFDIGNLANIQLHTPSGLLPFGTSVKVGYAPGMQTTVNSGNAAGANNNGTDAADAAFQVQVTSDTPVDGLKVGADYYRQTKDEKAAQAVVQQAESGSVFATYAYGPATFGLSRSLKANPLYSTHEASAATNTGGTVREYETNKMSVAFNVNDALSISYEQEESERTLVTNGAVFDIEAEAVQAAYTMGGMTLALSHGSIDNVSYTQSNDSKQTLVAVTMAF